MKRNNLLHRLHNYIPTSSEEMFHKDMIDFIHKNEDCFERMLTVGHITASAWILNKNHDKALLLHHAKLDRWFQLGGHCDGDSDTVAVAIKEAQEESGIISIEALIPEIFDIDIHFIPDNPKEKGHYHYDVRYLLHVTSDEDVQMNRESKALKWIGKNAKELPTDTPSVVRMHSKWVER